MEMGCDILKNSQSGPPCYSVPRVGIFCNELEIFLNRRNKTIRLDSKEDATSTKKS